jgi:Tol biopolymer transport system component
MLIIMLLPVNATTQDRRLDSADDYSDRLWNKERPNIEKLAQLTSRQGGAILFTIDRMFGYAKAGTARRLMTVPDTNSHCTFWSAALSHDGRSLAFLSSQKPKHCTISIYDLDTGAIRNLLDLPHNPWALTWSWDDSIIAFSGPSDLSPVIRAVSLRDGSVRTIVESSRLATERTQTGALLRFDNLASMQWSHNGDELLVGFLREIPTAQPNAYKTLGGVEYWINLANHDHITEFGDGDSASVSPVADRVAWYRGNKIVIANFDGTNGRVVTTAPRWMVFLSGTFKGPLVWSPNGKQLFFGTLESETCKDNVYLLQVDTGSSKRFLHRTCITIKDWR